MRAGEQESVRRTRPGRCSGSPQARAAGQPALTALQLVLLGKHLCTSSAPAVQLLVQAGPRPRRRPAGATGAAAGAAGVMLAEAAAAAVRQAAQEAEHHQGGGQQHHQNHAAVAQQGARRAGAAACRHAAGAGAGGRRAGKGPGPLAARIGARGRSCNALEAGRACWGSGRGEADAERRGGAFGERGGATCWFLCDPAERDD